MEDSRAVARSLFMYVLKRIPAEHELEYWQKRCASPAAIAEAIGAFFNCQEYNSLNGVMPGHPPGHFYSPINNPADLDVEAFRRAPSKVKDLPAIDINIVRQRELWSQIVSAPPVKDCRYNVNNPTYGPGDALVLSGMMAITRPKRIIEIGSGFSSARMLDTADAFDLPTKFTFIEPHPNVLQALLTPDDLVRCDIQISPVQKVPLSMFSYLDAGDILFVDSTHVMKAGSDVNYELFEILPAIRSGVLVHFHDAFWPFEYPADWIFERRYSWNELYGLRAFLSYNHEFAIQFFNDAFVRLCPHEVESAPAQARSQFLENPGGGLWLLKR